jgi:aspartyl-tRNA(Asn)/glutamyl-tRNA(Gln) amidotransferase subunit C
VDMDIHGIASLARLELTEDEVGRLGGQIRSILSYVEKLAELDTDAVEPTSHPVPMTTPQREDEVGTHLSLEETLSNAPNHDEASFIVPKVV